METESEDMAEGGLAWADRSEREVEVLLRDDMTTMRRNTLSTWSVISFYVKR